MKGGLLQKLLNKQKHVKFGDDVVGERWEELRQKIVSGSSKLEDMLPPLAENGKMLPFTIYMCSVAPDTHNIRIITQLLARLNAPDFGVLVPLLRDMVLSCAQYQKSVIDMIVRSFELSDSLAFAEALVAIIQAAPSIHSLVSNSVIRFFPQTSSPLEHQVRFMRSTLAVCARSSDVTMAALSRIFQHLVALDCELVMDSPDGQCLVDDGIAVKFAPQVELFVDFVKESPGDIFTLLLQLFDLYLIDLPKTVAIQFIYFYVASFSHENAETFIGFLLAKIFDVSASQRTRANAALYIASFVVRADYIYDELAIHIVDYVADFANKYSEYTRTESPENFKMNIASHSVFYYAVQCIIYIFCWRWRYWKSGGFNPDKRWKLKNLLGNALKASSAIDKNTTELFRSLGVIEGFGGEGISINRIAVWFPFDPCVIEEVERMIAPLYRVWKEEEPETLDKMLNKEIASICEKRLITIQTFGK